MLNRKQLQLLEFFLPSLGKYCSQDQVWSIIYILESDPNAVPARAVWLKNPVVASGLKQLQPRPFRPQKMTHFPAAAVIDARKLGLSKRGRQKGKSEVTTNRDLATKLRKRQAACSQISSSSYHATNYFALKLGGARIQLQLCDITIRACFFLP